MATAALARALCQASSGQCGSGGGPPPIAPNHLRRRSSLSRASLRHVGRGAGAPTGATGATPCGRNPARRPPTQHTLSRGPSARAWGLTLAADRAARAGAAPPSSPPLPPLTLHLFDRALLPAASASALGVCVSAGARRRRCRHHSAGAAAVEAGGGAAPTAAPGAAAPQLGWPRALLLCTTLGPCQHHPATALVLLPLHHPLPAGCV